MNERAISSLIVCSQIHELVDNCHSIALNLSAETRKKIPMNSLRMALAMLPSLYPTDLYSTDEEKEPILNEAGALHFAKTRSMGICYLLFDNLLEKLDAKFAEAINTRDEDYFLKNMAELLRGTLAESLTEPLQYIMCSPELTKEYKDYIWANLDSISEEVQDYKERVK